MEEKSENRGKATSPPRPRPKPCKNNIYNPTYPTSGSLPSRNQRPYMGFPNKTNKLIPIVKMAISNKPVISSALYNL